MTQIGFDGAMRKQVAQRGEKTFYSFFPLSLCSVACVFISHPKRNKETKNERKTLSLNANYGYADVVYSISLMSESHRPTSEMFSAINRSP